MQPAQGGARHETSARERTLRFKAKTVRLMPPVAIPPADLRVPIADDGDQSAEVLRRSALSRRTLALADALSAAVALVVSIEIVGDDTLRPLAIATIPL